MQIQKIIGSLLHALYKIVVMSVMDAWFVKV